MLLTALLDPKPVDYREEATATVLVAPDVRQALALEDGGTVRISTDRGRAVLGRLRSSDDEPDPGAIRVDRFARQVLKAFPHERLRLDTVDLPPAAEVLLIPLAGPPTTADGRGIPALKSLLAEQQVPVRAGMILHARLPQRRTSDRYEVHFVAGQEGVVTQATELWLISDDHDHGPGGHDHHHDQRRSTVLETTFEDVGGLTEQIEAVRELIELPLLFPQVYRQLGIAEPSGVVFHGAPGTGKTHLARAVANEIHANLFHINGPEVVGTYSGETELNLRRIFTEAAQDAPSIIVIDEVDAIVPARRSATSTSEARSVTQLLALMDGLKRSEGVLVIGTTNRLETLDPAVRRAGRFDREIHFPTPSASAREQILRIHAREMPLTEAAAAGLRSVAEQAHGFTGSDLMALCREAGLAALRRAAAGFIAQPSPAAFPPPEALEVTMDDFTAALSRLKPAVLRGSLLVEPGATWDDVGGHGRAKRRLRRLIDLAFRHPDAWARSGLARANGVLLHGPSGTGKTLMARAMAQDASVNFIQVNGPEIFTQWLGASEEGLRRVFDIARRSAPSVLFFDQLDALAPTRGELGSGDTRATFRIVNQLLAELDALDPTAHVLVVAATNSPVSVDPAVLGRFGIRVHLTLPDAQDRREILGIHLRDTRFADGTDVQALRDRLVTATEGFDGAALAALCTSATMAAWADVDFTGEPRLSVDHFEAAFDDHALG